MIHVARHTACAKIVVALGFAVAFNTGCVLPDVTAGGDVAETTTGEQPSTPPGHSESETSGKTDSDVTATTDGATAGSGGSSTAAASSTNGAGSTGNSAAGSRATVTAAAGSRASGAPSVNAVTAGAGAAPTNSSGAAGVASQSPATTTNAPSGSCGPEVTTAAADLGNPTTLGPFKPMHVERTGPAGSSWIYHPEELGMNGVKHPVFQWGPGAGNGPSNYLDHLNLLASHGFVIISQASTESGKVALDWLLAENQKQGSKWHQKLDPERVGRGGHSMGALQSLSEADDERLQLYVLVCGGSGGGGGAAAIDEPTIFLGGQGLGDTVNFEGDYAEVKGPTVFVRRMSTDHIYCARDNLGPWVAFMRWHFCNEEKWKEEFEPGGAYCTGAWAACETKNL